MSNRDLTNNSQDYTTLLLVLGWFLAALFLFALVLDERVQAFETFLWTYRSSIIGLGTLFLVSYLAFQTTIIANKAAAVRADSDQIAADRREIFSQKMRALLKISEFRQIWIDEFRHEISAFISIPPHRIESGEDVDLHGKIFSVMLRMNMGDPNTKPLMSAMTNFMNGALEGNDKKISEARIEVVTVGQEILKIEWDRLKADLSKAQTLEEALK